MDVARQRAQEKAAALRPRAFILELTKGCNLRCGYCYYAQRQDAYDPKRVMSPEVALRSVDVLFDEAPPGERVHVHVILPGIEPFVGHVDQVIVPAGGRVLVPKL